MKVTYYRTPEGFVGLTGESPRGFEGIVFAGRGPDDHGPNGGGPESVCEQGFTPGTDWVQVDASEVPDDWFEAIGYEERSHSEPESDPELKLKPLGPIEYVLPAYVIFMIIWYILERMGIL